MGYSDEAIYYFLLDGFVFFVERLNVVTNIYGYANIEKLRTDCFLVSMGAGAAIGVFSQMEVVIHEKDCDPLDWKWRFLCHSSVPGCGETGGRFGKGKSWMNRKPLKAKILSVLLSASIFLTSCSPGMTAYAADGTAFDVSVSDVETGKNTETEESMETDESAKTGKSAETDADGGVETTVGAETGESTETDENAETGGGTETDGGLETIVDAETEGSTETDENVETDADGSVEGIVDAETEESAKAEMETGEGTKTDENAETGEITGMETDGKTTDVEQDASTETDADAEVADVDLPDSDLSGLDFSGADYVELNNSYDTSQVSIRWYEQQGLVAVINENPENRRELTKEYAAYVSSKGASSLYISGFAGIAGSAFQGFTCLQDITVADTLEKIGGWAFMDCSGLESISFPDTLTQIGAHAFYKCQSLRLAELPESVTDLEIGAFWDCRSITLKRLPSGIDRINNYVFSGCSLLELEGLPDGISHIGNAAFSDCTSLALTELPESVTSIGSGAFGNCGKLALVNLPDGVESIGDTAFSGCVLLDWTELPSSITSIENAAFYGCTSLALTSLPAGVESIGSSAFKGCTSLALEELPAGLQVIKNYGFSECTELRISEFPDGLESVGERAFERCSGLTVAVLPESLTSIGAFAFYMCPKVSITSFPDSLKTVEEHAFWKADSTIVSEPNHASVSEKSAVQTYYTVQCITGTGSGDYDESNVIGTERYVGYYGDDVSDYVMAYSAKHPEIDGHQFVSYVVPKGNEKIILENGDAETFVYAVYMPDAKSTFTVALPASVTMDDFRIADGGDAMGIFAGKIDYQVSYKLKDSSSTLAVYMLDSNTGDSNSSYLQPGQVDPGCFNAETGGGIVCDTDKSLVAWTNGNVKTGAYSISGRPEGKYGAASYDSDADLYAGSGTIALTSNFPINETGAYCGHVTVNIRCR